MLIHIGLEEADRTAPFRLGAIERRISIGQKCSLIGAVARIHRNADAHADMKIVPFDLNGLGCRCQQAFGEPVGTGRQLVVRNDESKLIAADACQEGAVRNRR